MSEERTPIVLTIDPSESFVETPAIKKIVNRSLSYLAAGFPIHFSGPTGTGKTTLAMHVSHKLNQAIMLMFGDEEFGTSSLVGDKLGYRKRKLIDNFIHSVLKTEEDVSQRWVDNRLTTACKYGLTLIYDEFNRSRPEANNALLSVLEEGILTLPVSEEEEGYIKVHPNFKAIFTSNPEEYAGVHKTQDALLDRMVTIHLDYFDEETERAIVVAKTGISVQEAKKIIGILRDFRQANGVSRPVTIRPAILIGKVMKQQNIPVSANPIFIDICVDALASGRNHNEEAKKAVEIVIDLVQKHCPSPSQMVRNSWGRFVSKFSDQSKGGEI